MTTEPMKLLATAAFGLEAVLKRELMDLGANDISVQNGYVEYTGDLSMLVKSNLWLRTADRVVVKMGEFQADTFDALFEGTKALPWADWLPADAAFPVEGRSVKSKLESVPACQRIVKKAIVESLRDAHRVLALPEDGPLFPIEVALHKDVALLTIDTSGAGLHKRGYRIESAEAPIKETLAAAMVLLSRWLPHRPFADPLCGSGTIAIEAAMIAKKVAPGGHRRFLSEAWPALPASLWDDARNEAEATIRSDVSADIHASDVNPSLVEMARRHAERAGVAEMMTFSATDIRQFHPQEPYGCVVTNPPYGERLGEAAEVAELYRTMGKVAKSLPTWSWFVITSNPDFQRLFGKRADKNRKLYNGRIETHFYQYLGPLPPLPPRS